MTERANTQTLYTIADMARETERSHPAIKRKVKSLGITSQHQTGAGKELYTPTDLHKVRVALRRPNSKPNPSQ
jgi:hypothetical protein